MNPASHADFAVLEERIDTLEEREESTRRKFEAHLAEELADRKAVAEALQAIRFDVHEIRSGKRSLVRSAKMAVAVLAFGTAGFVAVARWTIVHWLQDLKIANDPSEWRRIQP